MGGWAVRFVFQSEVALANSFTVATQVPTTTVDDASAPVLEWLGRLRMLIGMPFEYLVADDGLLRPETIRFFHIDRDWTDAAVDGAIAAGTYGTRDRLLVQQRHEAVRGAVDEAERHRPASAAPRSTGTSAASLAGFLLRSRAVSGWPGLHVPRLPRHDAHW